MESIAEWIMLEGIPGPISLLKQHTWSRLPRRRSRQLLKDLLGGDSIASIDSALVLCHLHSTEVLPTVQIKAFMFQFMSTVSYPWEPPEST